jgi:hypothetical protein
LLPLKCESASLPIAAISGCKSHKRIVKTSKPNYPRLSFASQSSCLVPIIPNHPINTSCPSSALWSVTPLPASLLLSQASRCQSTHGPNSSLSFSRPRHPPKQHIVKSASTSYILSWKLLSRDSRSIYRASSNSSRNSFRIPRVPKSG